MIFKWGSSDDYPNERFVTISEASDMLGFKTRSKVLELIRNGILSTYKLPDTTRVRIRKSELLQKAQFKGSVKS